MSEHVLAAGAALHCGDGHRRLRPLPALRSLPRPQPGVRRICGPRLYGRDVQLTALDAALERVSCGESTIVVLEGRPGVGKTRLVDETAARAAARGLAVARASCDELDRYAPLASLLSALAHGPEPVLTPGLLGDGSGGTDRGFWLLTQIGELLGQRAARQPVVVLLDDVHRADPATLMALRALPQALAADRVLWILTVRRNHPDGQLHRVLDRLALLGASTLDLAQLSGEQVAELARDVLGTQPTAATLRQLDGARGNPALIMDLLSGLPAHAESESEPEPEARLPQGLHRRVRQRVHLLAPETRQFVGVAAVLGETFAPSHVAALLRQPTAWLLPVVAEAVDDGLMIDAGEDALCFRHPVVRRALHDGLPAALRASLHRAAAQLLLDDGGAPADAAAHLLAGARCGDPGTVAALADAVDRLAASSPAAAAELADRAVALTAADDPIRAHLVTRAVELSTWTGDLPAARRLAESARELTLCADDDATIRLSLAAGLVWRGRVVDAREQLPAVSGELSAAMRARVLAARAWVHLLAGDYTSACAPAREALTGTDPVATVTALGVQSQLAYHDGDTAAAVAVAEEAIRTRMRAPASRTRLPRLWLAIALSGTDRLGEAQRVCDAGERAAAEAGATWARAKWPARRAWLHLEQGRLDDAVQCADAAVEAASGLGLPRETIAADAAGALVAVLRGQLGQADARLARGCLHGAVRPIRMLTVWVRAQLLAAQGDTAAAGELVSDTFGPDPTITDLMELPVTAAPSLVRVALGSGRRELAARIAAVAARIADANPCVGGMRGAADHAHALLTGDAAALAEAAETLAGSGRPLAALSAAEDAGRARLAAGDVAAVRDLLDALSTATELGALAAAGRLRQLLRSAGVHRRPPSRRRPSSVGWESLSDAELRVARLAAEALTNQAIAGRLYISPHTVNTHLRHAFAKLGVNSRVELTRVVLAHTPAAAHVSQPIGTDVK